MQRRVALRRGMLQLLWDLHTHGKVMPEQQEALMQEYVDNIAAIDSIFDEHTAHQGTALQEMMARRRDMIDKQVRISTYYSFTL